MHLQHLGEFHKDPKSNLTLKLHLRIMETRLLASLKIFCNSYFKRHKMLIQIIHILYYQEDIMFLMWNLWKV